jgi:hypothetical protein
MNVLRLKPATSPAPDGRQSESALAIAIGTRRLLATHGFTSVTELTLASGRRADIAALGQDGTIWIVEIKSSLADFRADAKWPDYRDFSDRFFFAVADGFPTHILPPDTGLVLADGYGAAVVREAPEHRLAAARRKAMMLRFAHAAAGRLHLLADPQGATGWMD